MDIKITLDEQKITNKVTNDKLGIFVAHEWKRLIDPYTPRNTGTLMDKVKISPFQIYYTQKYARYVYYGRNFKFRKVNPCSTYEWDVKAAQSGQLTKLYRAVNSYLR